jgi:hypothetical protein
MYTIIYAPIIPYPTLFEEGVTGSWESRTARSTKNGWQKLNAVRVNRGRIAATIGLLSLLITIKNSELGDLIFTEDDQLTDITETKL